MRRENQNAGFMNLRALGTSYRYDHPEACGTFLQHKQKEEINVGGGIPFRGERRLQRKQNHLQPPKQSQSKKRSQIRSKEPVKGIGERKSEDAIVLWVCSAQPFLPAWQSVFNPQAFQRLNSRMWE